MLLINEIDLEQYLEGLISIELSPRWELTAMKVQAVVARTYALFQKANNQRQSLPSDNLSSPSALPWH